MRILLALCALLLAGGLAACGKKGPPAVPGPAGQVVYPRQYPAPEARPAEWGEAVAAPAPSSAAAPSNVSGTGISGIAVPGSAPQIPGASGAGSQNAPGQGGPSRTAPGQSAPELTMPGQQ